MSEINKLIEVATKEVGYLEKKSNKNLDSKTLNAGKNNYTKYARDLDSIKNFYNGKKQGFSWCDVFVDWCFVKAFGEKRARELLLQPTKSLGAGCKYSMNYYKKAKQFHTTPKAGDQIFFKNSKGEITHTGFVYKVDKTYVYTIEGNTSSGNDVVISNGGCVRKKKYKLTNKNIAGYGRPKYKVVEEKKPEVEPAQSRNKKYSLGKTYKTTTSLNLRYGAGTDKEIVCTMPKGTKVKWYGYYTGNWKLVKVTSGTYKGKTGYCSSNFLK
mgnify:CR=1 FL=1